MSKHTQKKSTAKSAMVSAATRTATRVPPRHSEVVGGLVAAILVIEGRTLAGRRHMDELMQAVEAGKQDDARKQFVLALRELTAAENHWRRAVTDAAGWTQAV